ncbi:DUF2516 family protein [Kribbia dieselivorans]|uniref:DUF2516 family protein n=1 Tax=Kribbia dieselivorans TaxID=331526 RepID=UPI0008387D8C|nr:DUF2516 family protein [Kribbia dieselivorans]
MEFLPAIRLGILTVLGLAAFIVEVIAFVDALRHRPDAYTAAGKLTKPAWVAITGIAALLGFVVMGNPLNLFGLLAVGAALVYVLDVRPALRRVLGNRGGSSGYGSGRW